MARNYGRPIVLAGLLVVLAAVLYYQWQGASASPAPAPAPARSAAAARATTGREAPPAPVPEVKLQALAEPRPDPTSAERNPFSFQPKAPPPAAQQAMVSRPASPVVTGPPVPPPPPPIPLKFIGIVEGAPRPGKLAVLSDGRDVYYGKEGDLIEGRYRIVRIGVESIEMTYVDGAGRQVIRLSGG